MAEAELIIGPRVPEGLAAVVEGLARQVLRHQPENIYTFAAHHFEELMKVREKVRRVVSSKGTIDCECAGERQVYASDCCANTCEFPYCKEQSYAGKTVGLLGGRVAREASIARKMTLSSRRREKRSSNRSGWSIQETVKACKRHEYGNKKERGKDMQQAGKRSVEMVSCDNSCERRSSDDTRGIVTGSRFPRSSSTGDIAWKNRRFGEGESQYSEFVIAKGITEGECVVSANGLKGKERSSGDRKKKPPSFELTSERRRYLNDSNDQSKDRKKLEESVTEVQQQVRGKEESCSWVEKQRRELNKFVGKLEESEAIGKLTAARLERDDGTKAATEKEKGDDGRLSYDDESREDAMRIEIFEETGSDGDEKHCKDIFSGARGDCLSIMFPAVVASRPPSSCKLSRNGLRMDETRKEQNNLVLPPISSDTSKSIKRESNLMLPSLSPSPTLEIQRVQQPRGVKEEEAETNDGGGEIDENKGHEMDVSLEEEQSWYELSEWARNGDGMMLLASEIASIVQQDIGGGEEISQNLNLRGKEAFEDSLNVTPDSIQLTQRPDSLERPESGEITNSEEEKERLEEEGKVEENGNWTGLKSKLIEIETVEKSIEDALASTRTGQQSDEVIEKSINFPSDRSNLIIEPSAREPIVQSENHSSEEERNCEEGAIESEHVAAPANTNALAKRTSNDETTVARLSDLEKSDQFSEETCYELAGALTREIPVSVTTVVLPDKTFLMGDDTVGEPVPPRSIMQPTLAEGQYLRSYGEAADPFGECVCPESVQCAASINANFLRCVKNAVERSSVRQDLANINEEEEGEEEEEEEEEETKGAEEKDGEEKENVGTEHSIASDRNYTLTDSRDIAREATLTESKCDAVEQKDTADAENVPSTASSNEQVETTTVSEGWRARSGSLEPCVPELNLDSLRDATISSYSRRSKRDSMNIDTQSDGESSDISFRETAFSADAATAFLDKHHLPLDVEEEIAKELIQNLMIETSKRQATATKDEKRQSNERQGVISAEETSQVDCFAINTQVDTSNENVVDGVERANSLEETGEKVTVCRTKQREAENSERKNATEEAISNDATLRQEENRETAARKIQSWMQKRFSKQRMGNVSTGLGWKMANTKVSSPSTIEENVEDRMNRRGCGKCSADAQETKECEENVDEAKIVKGRSELEEGKKKNIKRVSELSSIDLRHSGELHDTLPLLPLFYTSKNVRSGETAEAAVAAAAAVELQEESELDSIERRDSDCCCLTLQSSRSNVHCTIDMSENVSAAESSRLIPSRLPFSFLPCVIKHVPLDGRVTTVVPFAGIIFDAGTRSAFRETPKPLLIEEIAPSIEENENVQSVEEQPDSDSTVNKKDSMRNTFTTDEAVVSADNEHAETSLSSLFRGNGTDKGDRERETESEVEQ